MKTFTCLFFVIIYSNVLIAQKTHLINGSVANVDSGKIYLVNSAPKLYYEINAIDSSSIINGNFKIEKLKNKNYPTAHKFIIYSKRYKGTTGTIVLYPEDTHIKIDKIDEYISPVSTSFLINQEQEAYKLKFVDIIKQAQQLNRSEDSLYANTTVEQASKYETILKEKSYKLRKKSDSLLYEYILEYPNSYFSLWKLIERFDNFGYENIYLNAYNYLSKEVKNSFPAKTLYHKLSKASLLNIGTKFPMLNLKNQSSKNIVLNASKLKAKYVLVDFWFSECSPCLKEFEKYKSTYKKFQRSDIEILAISIDKEEKKELWAQTIKKYKLNWLNYRVLNDSICDTYNINSFPTNYLLDANGKILMKNISPEDLEKILIKMNSDLFFNDKSIEPE